MSDTFCADASRSANEPLFGTVQPTALWLALEYTGRWHPKAFEESDLAPDVKAYLSAITADPASRLLLIRQHPRPESIVLYVALAREAGSALYRFHLNHYDDLLALDLAAVRAGDAVYDAHRLPDPIFLVCTHGRRDPCCARYGIPVYEQMAALGGDSVWQTSHVGGHRFAANVVCLPEGIVYGRVDVDNAYTVFEAYRNRQLIPALLRGRSAYPRRAQAAEALLRLETGLSGRDALRLVDVVGETSRFVAADGTLHRVDLVEDETRITASCGESASERCIQYRLGRYVVEG